MALTWAVGLAGVATTLLVGGVLLDVVPASVYGIRELVAVAARAFVVGGTAGALFATLLARRERASTLETLRRGRVAAWGFLGAGGVAAALTLTAPVALPARVLISAVLGAGLFGAGAAVGALALARRGDVRVGRGADDAPSLLPPDPRE